MIGDTENMRKPALGCNLDDKGHNCCYQHTGEDQHCEIRLVGHKQRPGLQAVNGQCGDQHGSDAVTRDTESHHRNQCTAERGIVCRLTGPDPSRISFSERYFRILVDALGVSVGNHIGNTGAHAGQEADPEAGYKSEDHCFKILEIIRDSDAETLLPGSGCIRHFGFAFG